MTPAGGERPLTAGEAALAFAMFGDAIDTRPVRIRRRKWFPFQPLTTVMAPCGHIHFNPRSTLFQEDFSSVALPLQALFVHELTHVWQAQAKGRWYLPFARHPFCRYRYRLKPGKPFNAYGIEQQAEIVAHTFRARMGEPSPGTDPAALEAVLPF